MRLKTKSEGARVKVESRCNFFLTTIAPLNTRMLTSEEHWNVSWSLLIMTLSRLGITGEWGDNEKYMNQNSPTNNPSYLGLHFGSKNTSKISIIIENLSRNSVFFRTEVKPYFHQLLSLESLILLKKTSKLSIFNRLDIYLDLIEIFFGTVWNPWTIQPIPPINNYLKLSVPPPPNFLDVFVFMC